MFQITPDELQMLIQKRGLEIHKKENGTLYEAFKKAEKEIKKAIHEKNANQRKESVGFYTHRLRRLAEQMQQGTGLPDESAVRLVLDRDPGLAQAVLDEKDEQSEPAQATIIALAKAYEQQGLATEEAYKKVLRERPELRARYERMRRRH